MAVNRKLCVIITVHNTCLSLEEKASLLACYTHLRNYDCYLVFPEGMDTTAYTAVHPRLLLQPVPRVWLSSIQQYNRMKTDPAFYDLFDGYEFMMTYELDAYIFSSDIASHHGFDYDFIGAPVFEGYMNAQPDAPFLKILNSGFSIRNIAKGKHALYMLEGYKSTWKRYRFFLSNFPMLRKFINAEKLNIIYNDHLIQYFKGGRFNEDIIWSQVFPALFPFFKVAPPEAAYRFGFEVNAPKLYELNEHQLPLGCHAWAKFLSFWKDHIPMSA